MVPSGVAQGPRNPTPLPEERLTRYLYIGKEYPVYHPGDWFVHKYYSADKVPSIIELAKNTENPLLPIELIKKALEHIEYVQNPETLIFALAVCAKQAENVKLREAAYNSVPLICKNASHFILFNKFCSQIVKGNSPASHGYGHGWRKAVEKWYNSMTPLSLAKCVTLYKGRYGWKHKDIIKLAHYHSKSHAVDFIIKYLLYGLEKAKQSLPDPPEDAAEVIAFVEKIEHFRHCDDPVEAGRLVEVNNLLLEHVPAHLLKSEEVWVSLAQTLPLTTLLANLQRIHNLGFFYYESQVLNKVIEALGDEEKIHKENIQPASIVVIARNYANSGKPLSLEQQRARLESKRPVVPPKKPNGSVLLCLFKALTISSKNLTVTNLRYLIVLNMNQAAMTASTWHNTNVKVCEAVAILAFSFRLDPCTVVLSFKSTRENVETFNSKDTFREILEKISILEVENKNYDKPINWAVETNKKIDVFINVVEQGTQKLFKAEEQMKNYRKVMQRPNAKWVNCILCDSSTNFNRSNYDKNVLNLCGFDANMPRIIQAFAQSLF